MASRFHGISGPDSEELLSELLELFANRQVLALHRAAVRNDAATVLALVGGGVGVDATMLPLEAFAEVSRCNGLRFESIDVPRAEGPSGLLYLHGADGEQPNELYPTGAYDEPEADLDAAFQTPLLRACVAGAEAAVSALLAAGADRAFRSPCGRTAVGQAQAGAGDGAVRARLIAAVATPATVQPPPDVRARDEGDAERQATWPLFAEASGEGADAAVVRALLLAGSAVPPELASPEAAEWVALDVHALLLVAYAAAAV